MGPISVDFWRVSQRKDIPTSLFTSGENICWGPYAIKARNGSYHGDCQSEKILSKRGQKPSFFRVRKILSHRERYGVVGLVTVQLHIVELHAV